MNKLFLAFASSAALLAAPLTSQAQGGRGGRAAPVAPNVAPPAALAGGARPPSLPNISRTPSLGRFQRPYYGGNRYGGNRYGGHRYYHGGSYFYYDPFVYGFGYPYYYGPGFGLSYTVPLDDYYGDSPSYYSNGRVYEGRIVNESASGANTRYQPGSLASAVQRELKERGYYKGKIDGQFGSGSSRALREFQRDKDLPVTGRIDERTLAALGFERR